MIMLLCPDGREGSLTVYGDIYLRPQPPPANSTPQQRRQLLQSSMFFVALMAALS